MAKKKGKKKSNDKSSKAPKELIPFRAPELPKVELHHETKQSIFAVLFFGLSIILMLAGFNQAGPFGEFFYGIFSGLFGIGYYLIPVVCLILSGVYFIDHERKLGAAAFLGAVLFVLSGLGLIDLFFSGKSGLVGVFVGNIELIFGYVAAVILLIVFLLVSLLVTLNIPIKINFEKLFEDNEAEEEAGVDSVEVEVFESAAPEEPRDKKEKKSKTEKEEAEENFITDTSAPKEGKGSKKPTEATKKDFGNYVAPPLSLLKSSTEKPTVGDLRANANIIKRTLESFGIPVEMGEVTVGPKVTRYTLKPADGVKLSKIVALNQDLSLALAAHPIRIEAPIPGKSLVGIEVPNKSAALVRLGNLLADSGFATGSPLSFAIGRDITGDAIFGDISKMPHLLIAGATGSGKSVTVHSLITSLLYKNSPDSLRFIMVDPKRVELSIYAGIPHLISPVITEGKKSIAALKWSLNEMDRRYELLQNAGSRDIKSYNSSHKEEPLPYIVIVIDEMADLMSTFGRDVEGLIVRLAQMARAVGIHLVLSTQRPSVEVITGLIKANVPARIALQVASQIDSRTILDTAGAEKLLGGGDLLFVSADFSKPKRIQGAYIAEDEIKKVASFIRDNNKEILGSSEEVRIEEMSKADEKAKIVSSGEVFDEFLGGDDDDDLLEEAIEVVSEAGKASASLLQRRLKVGYARAARLLDIMESKGIIGPGDGAKPREVYLNKDSRLTQSGEGDF